MKNLVATGFTLLEMLVAVCILAILSAVAVPLLSGNDPQKLAVAAEEAANLLRLALSEARRTGGYVLVDGKSTSGQLKLYHSNVNAQMPPAAGTSAIDDPLTRRAAVLDVATHPYSQGVTLTPQFMAAGQPRPQLLIGPGLTPLRGFDGEGSNHGSLQAGSGIQLIYGAQAATVIIDSNTGLVSVP